MPVPRVSVRNSERKPISPREGTRNSIRTRPEPWLIIFVIRPLRTPICWVTTPMYSSGQSITSCSIGSRSGPSSTRRVITSGLPTDISYPSRRIISIRIASCSSPRPETWKASGVSVGSTPDRDVGQRLLLQALLELARGDVLAVAAAERGVVDRQHHRDRRLVDLDVRQRPRVLALGERLADAHVLDAGDGHDVARARLGDLDPLQPVVAVEQGDLGRRRRCRRAGRPPPPGPCAPGR